MASTTRIDRDRLVEVLDQQLDIITRAQALAAGVTENALRHRLRQGGPWRVLLPRVYIVTTGTPSRAQREMGAQLYAGPGSVITGPAALPCHRIRGPDSEFVDVLVPVTCERRSTEFVRLHRTHRLPESVYGFGPLRYALAARAVGDTVRGMTNLRDVRAVIADTVQRNRCEIAGLAAELAAGPRPHSALFREALFDVIGGIRSTAEADLKDLLAKSGLGMPLFNAKIYDGDEFVAMPDGWYPEFGVAIEVDSTAWHLSPDDHARDMQRQTRMGKRGIVVLRFTPKQVRTERAQVLAAIRDALESARGRPPLNLRTVPSA